MTELIDLLGRSFPILLGGGAVQLIVLMIKRRSEMRAADVAANKINVDIDAVVVASAERSLLLSDQARDRADKRAERMAAERDQAEAALADMQVELRSLRIEVATLRREVAFLNAGRTREPPELPQAG